MSDEVSVEGPLHPPDAVWLDARRARIPALTEELLRVMSERMYRAAADSTGMRAMAWAEAPEGARELWREAAREAWGVMATFGGAVVYGVEPPVAVDGEHVRERGGC